MKYVVFNINDKIIEEGTISASFENGWNDVVKLSIEIPTGGGISFEIHPEIWINIKNSEWMSISFDRFLKGDRTK